MASDIFDRDVSASCGFWSDEQGKLSTRVEPSSSCCQWPGSPMEGMCFIDVSSAIHIKVKSVKTIQKSPFQKSIVTHHCSFHSLRTVAESFAHSIPAFFSDTKAFPISFWQTKFYLNQNNFTKLENYYTSSHNMEVKKNGSLPIVLTCQNIAGFPRKTMIVGERRHKTEAKEKDDFKKWIFFMQKKVLTSLWVLCTACPPLPIGAPPQVKVNQNFGKKIEALLYLKKRHHS